MDSSSKPIDQHTSIVEATPANKRKKWNPAEVKELIYCLGNIKASGLDTAMPSVLMKEEVAVQLKAHMQSKGIKWNVGQRRDKYKKCT